jgi:hypothetical protein
VILDAITPSIQALGERRFTFGARFFRERIKMIVDALTSGIQTTIYSVSPQVEPVIDSLAAIIQSPFDSIAKAVKVAVGSKGRCHAADCQYCDADHYAFFHFSSFSFDLLIPGALYDWTPTLCDGLHKRAIYFS